MWPLIPRQLREIKHSIDYESGESTAAALFLQVTSLESGGSFSACSSLSPSIEGVVVNWFRRCAFGSHVGEWLALALVILLTLAFCIALLRLVFRLLKRERDTDESESDYWRIHGG